MRARNNINSYWNINSTYQVFLVLPDLRDLENIEKSSCTRDMLGTRTVFHFNFPRNLVFEKLFHNASLATPDVGESIAFVSSPLRTRVTQTFRTSLYPFSLVYPRFLLLFVAFTHPSIHPSIYPSLPSLPTEFIFIADSSPSFTPSPNRENFSILARNPRGIENYFPPLYAEVSRRSISKIRESFPERLLPARTPAR